MLVVGVLTVAGLVTLGAMFLPQIWLGSAGMAPGHSAFAGSDGGTAAPWHGWLIIGGFLLTVAWGVDRTRDRLRDLGTNR